jgi:hypothetical protein
MCEPFQNHLSGQVNPEDCKHIINSYEEYLEEKIRLKKIDTITNIQKRKLINAFNTFPVGKTITLQMDEIINFIPEPNQSNNDYIHHFLTKFNVDRDWYSENYILLVNDLVTNLSNYDERILAIRNNECRVCFAKHTPERGKKPYHVIACKLLPDNRIIAWTHFDSKENYINALKKQEATAISMKGLRTINNKQIVVKDYGEYENLKRKTPLYLGNGVLFELQKS